ncbi:MAG: hypothetical protein IIC67_08125 [Thaumarchaeota archaeon]|nr:hypothetical protein [Nitrososphaerota archaeon]
MAEKKPKSKTKKSPKKSLVDSVREDRVGLIERIRRKRVDRLTSKLSKVKSLP